MQDAFCLTNVFSRNTYPSGSLFHLSLVAKSIEICVRLWAKPLLQIARKKWIISFIDYGCTKEKFRSANNHL